MQFPMWPLTVADVVIVRYVAQVYYYYYYYFKWNTLLQYKMLTGLHVSVSITFTTLTTTFLLLFLQSCVCEPLCSMSPVAVFILLNVSWQVALIPM